MDPTWQGCVCAFWYVAALLSFVSCVAGSHLDVVMADASKWSRNPFELSIEGDKLYGRGTTDCLGACWPSAL